MKFATITSENGRILLRGYISGQLVFEKELTRSERAQMIRDLARDL